MYPVSPVLTYVPEDEYPPKEIVFARNQQQYNPLPAIEHGDRVTSRWHFSFLERLHVLFAGYIFVSQKTFGDPPPALSLSTMQPKPWR